MTDHKGLPVKGYTDQSTDKVALVNENKILEERVLRRIEELTAITEFGARPACDPRWLAIARSHIEEGFMAMNRAVFRPTRIKLPEDGE